MDGSFRIRVVPGDRAVRANRGESLLDALRSAGVFIEASCGGAGECGRCAVEVQDGEVDGPAPSLGPASLKLACRSRAVSDCTVKVLSASRSLSWTVSKGIAPEGQLFLGIDIGTTTISAALSGGDALPFAEMRRLNPQASWGSDVLRRLGAAADPDSRDSLKAAVRTAVKGLVADLARAASADASRIGSCAVACNSAMALLLLGFDPSDLSVAPFESGLERYGFIALDPVMFGLGSAARCELLPAIGSFVGADTTAGLLASRLGEGALPALFVDAGTNGEIVLASRDGTMLAASAAAGPAFEGGHLSCGGPATAGAVDGFSIRPDGGMDVSVIGGEEARWICGSGALRIVAALLDHGALDPSGRMLPTSPVVRGPDGGLAVEIRGASDGGIIFTQADVREVQLAVGAIRAAWRTLMREAGLGPGELKRIVLTGSFGGALDADAARRIGLIPSTGPAPEILGSGAVKGSLAVASGTAKRSECERLAASVRHVPLWGDDFQALFLECLEIGVRS